MPLPLKEVQLLNRWHKSDAVSFKLGSPDIVGVDRSGAGGTNSTGLLLYDGPAQSSISQRRVEDGAVGRYGARNKVLFNIDLEDGTPGDDSFVVQLLARTGPDAPWVTPSGWAVASTLGSLAHRWVDLYPEYLLELLIGLGTGPGAQSTMSLTWNNNPVDGELLIVRDGVSPDVYIVFRAEGTGAQQHEKGWLDEHPFYVCEIVDTPGGGTYSGTKDNFRLVMIALATAGHIRTNTPGGGASTTTWNNRNRGSEFNGVIVPDSSEGAITGGTYAGGTGLGTFASVSLTYR